MSVLSYFKINKVFPKTKNTLWGMNPIFHTGLPFLFGDLCDKQFLLKVFHLFLLYLCVSSATSSLLQLRPKLLL